ncbi:hypothetical protein GCM10023189_22370 [Nibrella saemangeumensis]|uniref:Secretion system C-terminal sorting domain-containing protein n=1 Tax=Nibrella saemangeumensis TaxID=1084526 RepID=A0ABP8MRR7_9BACT
MRAVDPGGQFVTTTFAISVNNSRGRVGVAMETSTPWQIYPNPAENYVSVTLPSDVDAATISVTFVSAGGRLYRAEKMEVIADGVRLPVYTLSSGLYLLVIKQNDCVLASKKFSKN